MSLEDVIFHTLLPHKEELISWTHEEITDLFLGFGNINIYFTSDDNHKGAKNLAGTFRYNGGCIVKALTKLEIEEKFNYLDFYWGIAAAAGEGIREDLNNALEVAGFTVYEHFDKDMDGVILTPITPSLKGMKMLN